MAQAEATVREHSAAHDPRRSLRADSVRFIGTVGSAVGIQAPTGGVTFLPALMAGIVGSAGPVAFGLAIVAMLFVAYAFITFTRDSSSACTSPTRPRSIVATPTSWRPCSGPAA